MGMRSVDTFIQSMAELALPNILNVCPESAMELKSI